MIGVLATQDDVIGFGLTGIKQEKEVKENIEPEELLTEIHNMSEKVEIIIINERLLDKVRQDKSIENIAFWEIPDNLEKTNVDDIEKLIKDTLGIELKE